MSAVVDTHASTSARRHDGYGNVEDDDHGNNQEQQLLARMTAEEKLLLVCELCRRPPPSLSGLSSGGGSVQLFLLACLHSCCHECVDQMSAAAAVVDVDDDYGTAAADAAKPSQLIGDRYSGAWPNRSRVATDPSSSGRPLSSVLCPTCGVLTDAGELKRNAFAEARLRTLLVTLNGGTDGAAPVCSVCSDRPGGSGDAAAMAAAVAQYWCPECAKYLCFSCRKRHDVFKREHHVAPANSTLCDGNSGSDNRRPAASGVAAAAATVALVRCAAHAGAACDFYCANCEALRCSECVKACAAERHETGAVGRPRAEGHASRIADALRAELANLRTKAAPRADACADVRQLLVAARRRDEERARKIKKEAIEATLRSCDLARSELVAKYGALTDRARRLEAETAGILALIATIVDASDVCTTLGRRKALLSCAARFENELEQIAAELNVPLTVADDGSSGNVDVSCGRRSMVKQSCVEGSEEGREFVAVVERWIGWPREHRGFPLVPEESGPTAGEPSARLHGHVASPEQQQEQLEQKQQPHEHGASSEQQQEQIQQKQQPEQQLQQQQQLPLISQGGTQPPPPPLPSATVASSTDPSNPATAATVAASVEPTLVFNDTDDCFGLRVDCRDVAMTSDGRVLLAALKHGLKHFAPDGRKLPTWRPGFGADGGPAIVSSVDVLAGSDGAAGESVFERVVVSLIDVQRVVVLRREEVTTATNRAERPSAKPEDGGGGFYRGAYVEERLVDLTTSPFRVSAFGCRFAVAGAHVTDNRESRGYHVVVGRHWSPGPHVELFRVPPSPAAAPAVAAASGGCTLELQQQFEHDVISLAIADSFLVTLIQLPATSSSATVYVLEAINFDGSRLWSIKSPYELLDICTVPPPSLLPPQLTVSGSSAAAAAAPPVLYVTVPKRERVCAYSINGDSCKLLGDVLIGGGGGRHTLTAPGRLSLGYRRVASADGSAVWLPALAVLIAQDAVAVFVAQPAATAAAAAR